MLLIGSAGVSAAEYEKNGFPCVNDLCIGDGLAELSALKFTPVVFSPKGQLDGSASFDDLTPDAVKYNYRGDYSKVMKNLMKRRFDLTTLKALPHITASCSITGPIGLVGTYVSKDGNKTKVTIGLGPDMSTTSSEQSWRVIKIARTYPRPSSVNQEKEINAALEARYHDMVLKNPNRPDGKRVFYTHAANTLEFDLSFPNNAGDRMIANPQCSDGKSVKLD